MTQLALGLVLAAAVIHASWNFLAKRAAGGPAFVWLYSVLMPVFYAPVIIVFAILARPALDLADFAFIFGTSILHVIYFLLLNRGYRIGDLSLVYPLARGTGPMLATVGAVILLDERPTLPGIVGIGCIGLGILVISGGWNALRTRRTQAGIPDALLIGVFIASYTLWDKYAMSVLLIAPLAYRWFADLFRALIMTGLMRDRREEARYEWRAHRREAVGVAIMCPIAYTLVLVAMRIGPVSYIAALRETSILIGTIMGTLLLGEKGAAYRWVGAAVMVAGVISLGLGG